MPRLNFVRFVRPMASSHLTRPGESAPELLAVSFSYPPLAYPRSGQVARLLKNIPFSTTLVCADERGAHRDPTLEPDAEASLRACLRVPFPVGHWRARADAAASRLRLPVWGKTPDQYASWTSPALRAVAEFTKSQVYRPDIIVSFGQPMSDHLVGLKLKQLFRVPWAAHFSDPWTDNPFNRHDALTRRLNLSLERKVMETADLLVFTSRETVDLVMAKYAPEWRRKARVLPHSFDASLYAREARAPGEETIVRYTGEFYGRRTPRPLVETLRAILSGSPRLLEGVRFELIGQISPDALAESGIESLPEGLVMMRPPVSYAESLSLAAAADGLLIVDAPAARSVFLPSKLVDYIGAARPILGLTPPGASDELIRRLGGWAADSSDAAAMRIAAEAFLAFLSQNRNNRRTWGDPEVRAAYEASAVAESFEGMMRELLG